MKKKKALITGIRRQDGAYLVKNLQDHGYEVSEVLYRPADVKDLRGDPSEAHRVPGWKSRIKFREPVSMMVEYDMRTV